MKIKSPHSEMRWLFSFGDVQFLVKWRGEGLVEVFLCAHKTLANLSVIGTGIQLSTQLAVLRSWWFKPYFTIFVVLPCSVSFNCVITSRKQGRLGDGSLFLGFPTIFNNIFGSVRANVKSMSWGLLVAYGRRLQETPPFLIMCRSLQVSGKHGATVANFRNGSFFEAHVWNGQQDFGWYFLDCTFFDMLTSLVHIICFPAYYEPQIVAFWVSTFFLEETFC